MAKETTPVKTSVTAKRAGTKAAPAKTAKPAVTTVKAAAKKPVGEVKTAAKAVKPAAVKPVAKTTPAKSVSNTKTAAPAIAKTTKPAPKPSASAEPVAKAASAKPAAIKKATKATTPAVSDVKPAAKAAPKATAKAKSTGPAKVTAKAATKAAPAPSPTPVAATKPAAKKAPAKKTPAPAALKAATPVAQEAKPAAKPKAAPKTATKAKSTEPAKVTAKAAAKAAPARSPAPVAVTQPAVKKTATKAKTAAPAGTKAAPAKAASLAKMPEPKLWVKSYPEGVPAEIGPLPYENINELFTAAYKKYANRPAFTCMGKAMSYAEMDRHSRDLGAWLQSRGLVKGDRVAVMMPNILQYPVAIAAILRAGLTVVNINPLYTPRELEHQLKDSGAKAIIILENFAITLQKVLTATPIKHIVVATMGDMLGLKGHIVNLVVRRVKKMVPAWTLPGHTSFKTALSQGAGLTLKPVEIKSNDVAFLQYTGGTTGVSKGAVLMHSNIVANVTQMRFWVEVGFKKKGRPDNLTFICALPLYHIFGLTVNAMISMELGGNNILIPNPRDIPAFVKELQKVPIHVFPGLNTLFNGLLNNEDFRKLNFTGLVLSLGGGMAVQRPVADRWYEVTGNLITEGFGLSETSPVASANRLDATEFSGTIGTPLPSTDFSIRDDDGKELPLLEVGEICIRGPQVMAGYWNRPDETAKVMTSDGFFRSGDMGYMDERGYTKIVDRKKDMILVSGFNVYPNEIEEVAMEHPGVREAAAIGVPNEHSGEVVKLFIVRKDPLLTEDAIKAFCAERLTNYKRPRTIEFRDELPKSNVGKILRRELRG